MHHSYLSRKIQRTLSYCCLLCTTNHQLVQIESRSSELLQLYQGRRKFFRPNVLNLFLQPQNKEMATLPILWHYKLCYHKFLNNTLRKFEDTQKRHEMRTFMANQALALISPWAEKRMNILVMLKALKCLIADFLDINAEIIVLHKQVDPRPSQKSCSKFLKKEDQTTKIFYKKYKNPVCAAHAYSYFFCKECL